MAGLKRCLGIDLGSSRIKVAEMAVEKSGMRLIRLLQADVDIPPGTDDDERSLRMSRVLRKLIKDNKVATKDALFGIPGQAVFQRIVKLPRTTPDRLRRIIQYEARQQIPFPLEQTNYEYQVFADEQSADEVEVLLVAIQREKINHFLRLFRRMGLRIVGVGVSHLALFNFHRLRAGFLPRAAKAAGRTPAPASAKAPGKKSSFGLGMFKKAQPAATPAAEEEPPAGEDFEAGAEEDLFGGGELFEEVKGYVNIGATAMDLAIEKKGGGGLGFCRPIPHAGNGLTRAVQDALSLDSYREAERVKRDETVVLSTVAEMEMGDKKINRPASEALTRVVERRIIGELRRSLDFFVSQPDGMAVDKLVVTGGQAHLPHLAEYIEEKMGLPTEVLDAFESPVVTVEPSLDGSDWASGAVAIGLAAQGLGLSATQVDFLPQEMKTVLQFKARYKEVAAMVALLLGMVVLSTQAGTGRKAIYDQMAADFAQRNDAGARKVVADFEKLKADRKGIAEEVTSLTKLADQRDVWLQFWAEMIVEKPPELVLDYVLFDSDGKVRLIGESVTQIPIQTFVMNLRRRTDLIVGSPEVGLKKQRDPYKRFKDAEVFVFDIALKHAHKHSRIKPLGTATPFK